MMILSSDDIVKKDKINFEQNHAVIGTECPLCKGYGDWILQENPKDGIEYWHQEHCEQCNAWGYVESGSKDASCVHEMRELGTAECREKDIQHFGMCYHVYECIKCGTVNSYDSSD
jgi:hypothetical protein